MAREKMPEFKRKGNWKNAPGSQAATKKKAPVGMGAKPKAKPAKPKIGAGAKPKPKPESVKAKGYKRTGKVAPEPPNRSKSFISKYKKLAEGGGFIQGVEGHSPIGRARRARSWTENLVKDNAKASSRSTAGKVQQSTRSMSQKKRKPLNTGARSSRTSGTGYKEGSFMDRMTRAVRRNVYGKK